MKQIIIYFENAQILHKNILQRVLRLQISIFFLFFMKKLK